MNASALSVLAMLVVAGLPADAPIPPPRTPAVHVVYFTPADRDPGLGYVDRLDRIMSDVQSFYAEEMERNGYGRTTFRLQRDPVGRLVVRLVRSARTYARGETVEWDDIGEQVKTALARERIETERAHVIVFQNLIFSEGLTLDCWAPYAGLGDHLSGRACVTDHPLLDPLNMPKAEPRVVTFGRERPLNDWVVSHMGGVAHELGHALGLPHNRELPEDAQTLGTALMGRGNYTYRAERIGKPRGSFLSKAHARILSRHPLFRGVPYPRRRSADCDLSALTFRNNSGAIGIEGRVRAAIPTAGLAVYLDPLPQGSDYDAWSWLANVKPGGAFAFDLPRQQAGIYEMRLRFVHRDGSRSQFDFPFRLNDPDRPPVEELTRMHLYNRTALRGYERRDARAVQKGVEELSALEDLWLAKARLLLAALKAKPATPVAPASLGPDMTRFPLAHAVWESAEVGWAKPRRDILEDSGYLLQSSDRAHATGLYAHADSRYVFRLGGQWKRFRSGCGLQNWVPGSVAFKVKGDGRVLYESGKVADWVERQCDISVEGIDTLELIVDQAGDGKWGDCGIWFSPLLVR